MTTGDELLRELLRCAAQLQARTDEFGDLVAGRVEERDFEIRLPGNEVTVRTIRLRPAGSAGFNARRVAEPENQWQPALGSDDQRVYLTPTLAFEGTSDECEQVRKAWGQVPEPLAAELAALDSRFCDALQLTIEERIIEVRAWTGVGTQPDREVLQRITQVLSVSLALAAVWDIASGDTQAESSYRASPEGAGAPLANELGALSAAIDQAGLSVAAITRSHDSNVAGEAADLDLATAAAGIAPSAKGRSAALTVIAGVIWLVVSVAALFLLGFGSQVPGLNVAQGVALVVGAVMIAIGVNFLTGRGRVTTAVGIGASRSVDASELHGSGVLLLAIGLLCTAVAFLLPLVVQ